MKKPLAIHRGFTLVELLLTMGILSLLMVIIMRVFIDMIELRLDAEAESAVSQDSRYIYARLAYDINRASAVTVPPAVGGSGPALNLTISGVTYTYAVDAGGQLTLNTGSGAVALTSAGTKVTNATFTRRGGATGAQAVTLNITLDSTITTVRGPISRTINTTVTTR